MLLIGIVHYSIKLNSTILLILAINLTVAVRVVKDLAVVLLATRTPVSKLNLLHIWREEENIILIARV